MKIFQFDMSEAPEDATEFFYNILREYSRSVQRLPRFMLGYQKNRMRVHRDELFASFIWIWLEGGKRVGRDMSDVPVTKFGTLVSVQYNEKPLSHQERGA